MGLRGRSRRPCPHRTPPKLTPATHPRRSGIRGHHHNGGVDVGSPRGCGRLEPRRWIRLLRDRATPAVLVGGQAGAAGPGAAATAAGRHGFGCFATTGHRFGGAQFGGIPGWAEPAGGCHPGASVCPARAVGPTRDGRGRFVPFRPRGRPVCCAWLSPVRFRRCVSKPGLAVRADSLIGMAELAVRSAATPFKQGL
jgi:hypothetical protein